MKQKDLTQGPLFWQIVIFSVPLMLSSVMQLLFNTADTVMVGRFGGDTALECETALAAVGSCGPLIRLIINLFMGLAVGAGVGVAQNIGAKRYKDVDEVVHTSVLLALLLGFFVTLIGFFFAPSLLQLMGTAPAVLAEATRYMKAYFLGMPASMVYNYCAAILRSKGDTQRPLLFLSVAGVVNVGLNFVMVLVFRMGAMGVGIATSVSQCVSCALILAFMMHLDGTCRVSLRKIRFYSDKLKQIIRVGLPAGLQGSVFALANVMVQSSVNSFGQTVVAGSVAASNLTGYMDVIQESVYHAAMTFVAQNLGAGNRKRVENSTVYSVAFVSVVGFLCGRLVLAFGDSLLGIYIKDNPAVIEAGMVRLRIMVGTYFLAGIMDVGCGVLRGLGKSLPAMIFSLAGCCAFRILWIKTVFAAHHTMRCLFILYPISWLLTSVAHFVLIVIVLRRLRKQDTYKIANL